MRTKRGYKDINLATGNKTNLVTSQFKPQFPCHLLDNFQADGGGILLVVNGEEGDASFMFSNDGVGRNNPGTARLASPFGCYSHTDFADAWTQLDTLKRVLLKAIKEILVICGQTMIALRKALKADVKVPACLNSVAHEATLQLVGNNPTCQFPNTPSNVSSHGKFLPLRRAWTLAPLHFQQVLGERCPYAT